MEVVLSLIALVEVLITVTQTAVPLTGK